MTYKVHANGEEIAVETSPTNVLFVALKSALTELGHADLQTMMEDENAQFDIKLHGANKTVLRSITKA